MQTDVAIIGGGPAGTACALALRAHAPALSVAVYEASHYDALRIGETLPPAARTILQHLGVFDTFRAQGHREVHGTTSTWGSGSLRENDFLQYAKGPGWHLDRAAFDAMLADEAALRGASVFRGTAVRSLDEVSARFFVDATGSASIATRHFGARFVAIDHLVSFARIFEDEDGRDPRTHVEAFEDGWWYTASLPGGRRIVACFTDADIARRLRLSEPDVWMQLARSLAGDARPCSDVVARSAESRYLEPCCGDNWIAIGDAASRFDPLSSQGIIKAMRSGIFAAYAIGDGPMGFRRYERIMRAEFDAYLALRTRFYAEENRWDRAFWRFRSAAAKPPLSDPDHKAVALQSVSKLSG